MKGHATERPRGHTYSEAHGVDASKHAVPYIISVNKLTLPKGKVVVEGKE
jgi:hypothetical protein